jgi:hypothetical protein
VSHFAKIENGLVTQVIVAEQDVINSGLVGDPSQWVQTSYNTRHGEHLQAGTALRGNYACIGSIYDAENDVFYAPSPYPSWILNTTQWRWLAPVAHPGDGDYEWDEPTLSWKLVVIPE